MILALQQLWRIPRNGRLRGSRFICVCSDPLNQWYSVYDMKLIIVRGVEHLLGEGVWNPLQRGRKGHPTLYKLLPCFLFQSVQPFWVSKMGSFFNLHWWITQTPWARATRGVGNMLPQKILKSWCSETSFLMFWEDKKLCLKCSVFMPVFMFTICTQLLQSQECIITAPEIIAGSCSDTKRVKMSE